MTALLGEGNGAGLRDPSERFLCNACETEAKDSYNSPGQRLVAEGLLIHWL